MFLSIISLQNVELKFNLRTAFKKTTFFSLNFKKLGIFNIVLTFNIYKKVLEFLVPYKKVKVNSCYKCEMCPHIGALITHM